MDKVRTGYAAGGISVGLNVILFAAKLWVGLSVGSLALIADGWHTLSDSLTSVVALIGIKISAVPPDEEHDFGHGRAEVIASLIIGILLGLVAFNILTEGIGRFWEGTSPDYNTAVIVVLAVSVIGKEIMAQYSFRIAKRIESRSLKADGWHHRSDALSSALLLVGVLIFPHFRWMDRVLAIAISLFIFYAAYEILGKAVRSLMGESASPELKERVKEIAADCFDRDMDIHHLHLHEYGDHSELTFHIRLPGEMRLIKAHDMAHTLEECIREELEIEPTIHLDPMKEGTAE